LTDKYYISVVRSLYALGVREAVKSKGAPFNVVYSLNAVTMKGSMLGGSPDTRVSHVLRLLKEKTAIHKLVNSIWKKK
jgi:hypothetical protein